MAMLWLVSSHALAARLDSSNWGSRRVDSLLSPPSNLRVGLTNGTAPIPLSGSDSVLTNLTDGNPATVIELGNRTSLSIDLGQTSVVHRVYFTGGNRQQAWWPENYANRERPPLGLIVLSLGNTAQSLQPVAHYTVPYDAGNPVNTEADLRFNPASARYIKIELLTQVTWGTAHWPGYAVATQPPPTNVAWQVAELEVYGFVGPLVREHAVVLPTNAAAPLSLAASELSYYLGELAGKPHPIINPAQTNNYPGTLYAIVDLKPLAPDYATMLTNRARGVLPTNEVNVTASGRVVSFTGWPYRCVLWSVWEFLERQGVRWVYPDGHGDLVPVGGGVNLGVLPLHYAASAKIIYANWDTGVFQPWPAWMKQSIRQEYLYPWRNRWTGAWSAGPLGGAEIPKQPATGIPLDSQYSEGFSGYPHNMNSVLPPRVLAANSAWWGSADGITYTNIGVQFEMASTPAALWIASKVTNYAASYPIASTSPLSLHPASQSFQLLPMDGVAFSVGVEMQAATNLYGGAKSYLPWRATTGYSFSGGAYYKLLATVASNAPNQLIGGLAYADIFDAPRSNYPANVRMEVTLWGAPNLPLSSPVNSNMWSALTNWSRACSKLAYYDYALLFVDYWQRSPLVPVPMVSALVGNANKLGEIGALDGGCQAFVGAVPQVAYSSLNYNPWAFYAYPRTRWNTNYTATNLLTEFFEGYYKEAAVPMRAYYDTMENWHLTNNVDLHNLIGYCYWIGPGAFPRSLLQQMRTHLQAAQGLATNWYVADRITDAIQSWQYCCTNQGINDPATLTDFSSFPTVPSSGVYSVSVTNMAQYWPTRSIAGYYYAPSFKGDGGGRLDFNGAAIAAQTLNFTAAGQYKADVVSFCSYPPNGWPSQKVYLGASSSGAYTITNTTPQTNSFVFNVPSATALDLVISQDVNGRFLSVTKIYLSKQ